MVGDVDAEGGSKDAKDSVGGVLGLVRVMDRWILLEG